MIELRPPRAADAESLFPLIFRTAVTDTLLWEGPESMDAFQRDLGLREAKARLGESHYFTIVESETQRPIGTVDLRLDEDGLGTTLGLWIGIPYQGKGYGTMVVREMLAHAFEHLGKESVKAEVFVGNWASRRIFEKNGFKLVKTVQQSVVKRDKPVDEWVFVVTRGDFQRLAGVGKRAGAKPRQPGGRQPSRPRA